MLKALSNVDENSKHSNPFIPENVTQEKLLQKHWAAMQQLRIPEEQLQAIIEDDYHFRLIQQALRDRHGQTDALAKQIAPELIRERLREIREQQAAAQAELDAQEQLKREEQRKLSIQRELAEARIKARQALNISLESERNDESDVDEDETERSNNDMMASPLAKSIKPNNKSPTSVTNTVSLSDEHFMAFKPGLVEEEDGDIQEVEE